MRGSKQLAENNSELHRVMRDGWYTAAMRYWQSQQQVVMQETVFSFGRINTMPADMQERYQKVNDNRKTSKSIG